MHIVPSPLNVDILTDSQRLLDIMVTLGISTTMEVVALHTPS